MFSRYTVRDLGDLRWMRSQGAGQCKFALGNVLASLSYDAD